MIFIFFLPTKIFCFRVFMLTFNRKLVNNKTKVYYMIIYLNYNVYFLMEIKINLIIKELLIPYNSIFFLYMVGNSSG